MLRARRSRAHGVSRPDGQRAFWDRAAQHYDGFYTGQWSVFEDLQVRERLARLLPPDCDILDLGCGTGLAYRLASEVTTMRSYLGFDISPAMIEIAQKRYPAGLFMTGDMADLSGVAAEQFDAVLALFTTLSYSSNTKATLVGAFRVLRPGGVLLISVLSRWSLRRLVQGKYAESEAYGTRGLEAEDAPEVFTFCTRQIKRFVREVGFSDVRVWGQSVLSGVLEYPRLWPMSRLLSRVTPSLAHNLYVEAVRR